MKHMDEIIQVLRDQKTLLEETYGVKEMGIFGDVLNSMEKAEILLEGVSYVEFEADFHINLPWSELLRS